MAGLLFRIVWLCEAGVFNQRASSPNDRNVCENCGLGPLLLFASAFESGNLQGCQPGPKLPVFVILCNLTILVDGHVRLGWVEVLERFPDEVVGGRFEGIVRNRVGIQELLEVADGFLVVAVIEMLLPLLIVSIDSLLF